MNYYLENKDAYDRKVEQLQEVVLNNHTYTHRANRFKEILTQYYDKYKIAIKIPAPSWDEVHKWGDFYLAEGLMKEFIKNDIAVKLQVLPQWDEDTDAICDAVIVLRGLSKYKPKLPHKNIMWNISHPSDIGLREYNKYDYVFFASKKMQDMFKNKLHVRTGVLPQCTDPDVMTSVDNGGIILTIQDMIFAANFRIIKFCRMNVSRGNMK